MTNAITVVRSNFMPDAQVGEGSQIEPDWDIAAQPAPDFDVDQRVNW